MRFVEIDVFGIYVAPMALMMVAAGLVFFVLRRLMVRLGLFAMIWHAGLFEFALYLIILSAIVLLIATLHVRA